jgi:hypothetical protein
MIWASDAPGPPHCGAGPSLRANRHCAERGCAWRPYAERGVDALATEIPTGLVKADEVKIAIREGGRAVTQDASRLVREQLHAALLAVRERVVVAGVPGIPRGLVGAQAPLVRRECERDAC